MCCLNSATVHTGQSLGFSDSSVGKESACNTGDPGSIPGLGRAPVEGKGYPLQHSGLESSMDCIVHRVTNSRTRLSDFHFQFIFRDNIYDIELINSYLYIHFIFIYAKRSCSLKSRLVSTENQTGGLPLY